MNNNLIFLFLAYSMLSCTKSNSDVEALVPVNSTIPFLNKNKISNFDAVQLGNIIGKAKVVVGNYEQNGFLITETRYDQNGIYITTKFDLWKEENGYIKLYNNKSSLDVIRIFKINPILNESWQDTNVHGEIVTHKVVDLDSLIVVPAGSFHCKVIKYDLSSGVNESYTFWNDQYGKIQEDRGYIRIKLKSYN